ncbi:MAG: type-F conjugative transfer system protein TraW [Gammaproteobacteria bacterium]
MQIVRLLFSGAIVSGCLLTALLWTPPLTAKNLGTIGKTYRIAETDMLEMIMNKLHAMESKGLIREHQQQFKARVKQNVLRPQPIPLPMTTVERRHHYDPSITAEQDIVDDKGRLVVAAGTSVNPLDLMDLPTVLLFFNGDDEAQLCWVKQQIKTVAEVTLILVQGDIEKMTEHFEQTIYFDQFGKLVAQLGITHVPAIVTQVDKQLLITESVPCLG